MKAKRLAALGLVLLMLVSITGCAGTGNGEAKENLDTQADAARLEEQTGLTVVSVLVDLPMETRYAAPAGEVMERTLRRMPGFMKDFMLKIEYIPPACDGQERQIAMSRLRTEIMAGKGPDLLLCSQKLYNASFSGENDTPFFNFPAQAMENQLFLPLDEYIEKAEYLDMDGLQPVVMAAGRSEEGQQILPLAYTCRVTLFDREEYTPTAELPMTWEEMTEDSDPAIRFSSHQYLPNIIGELADYSKDEPAFTEEELRTWAGRSFATWQTIPENLREDQPLCLPIDLLMLDSCQVDLAGEREYTMIPCYNLSGGVTAEITAFGAINRNARRPEEAFRILDYLMDSEIQQSSPLFQSRISGIPVYTGTGNSDTPATSYWKMNEANYQAFTQVQEQINVANFPGPLDECLWMVESYNQEVLEKSCHEQYMLMKMYLAES